MTCPQCKGFSASSTYGFDCEPCRSTGNVPVHADTEQEIIKLRESYKAAVEKLLVGGCPNPTAKEVQQQLAEGHPGNVKVVQDLEDPTLMHVTATLPGRVSK